MRVLQGNKTIAVKLADKLIERFSNSDWKQKVRFQYNKNRKCFGIAIGSSYFAKITQGRTFTLQRAFYICLDSDSCSDYLVNFRVKKGEEYFKEFNDIYNALLLEIENINNKSIEKIIDRL